MPLRHDLLLVNLFRIQLPLTSSMHCFTLCAMSSVATLIAVCSGTDLNLSVFLDSIFPVFHPGLPSRFYSRTNLLLSLNVPISGTSIFRLSQSRTSSSPRSRFRVPKPSTCHPLLLTPALFHDTYPSSSLCCSLWGLLSFRFRMPTSTSPLALTCSFLRTPLLSTVQCFDHFVALLRRLVAVVPSSSWSVLLPHLRFLLLDLHLAFSLPTTHPDLSVLSARAFLQLPCRCSLVFFELCHCLNL